MIFNQFFWYAYLPLKFNQINTVKNVWRQEETGEIDNESHRNTGKVSMNGKQCEMSVRWNVIPFIFEK